MEAAAHAFAAAELNPFGEAEILELGDARAVYCGAWSPVHGVLGLGLSGPVEERDLREIERFYFKKERDPAFWITPETDPSLTALLAHEYHPVKSIPVHGAALNADLCLPEPNGSSQPDHHQWTIAFSLTLDPNAKEPGLLALTKLHQKETRRYLAGGGNCASYTFFHRGIALVPAPSTHTLLALQAHEARQWKAEFLVTGAASPLPFLYERSLYVKKI